MKKDSFILDDLSDDTFGVLVLRNGYLEVTAPHLCFGTKEIVRFELCPEHARRLIRLIKKGVKQLRKAGQDNFWVNSIGFESPFNSEAVGETEWTLDPYQS